MANSGAGGEASALDASVAVGGPTQGEPDWVALEIAGLQRSIEKLQIQLDGAKSALARAIAQQKEN